MRFSDENRNGASSDDSSSASCSGRGEQDIRRIAPLPLPPRHRRVAGAGLDLDRQTHLGDRRFQIARDIDRERLQRRDVEGVQAARCAARRAGGDDFAASIAALPLPRAGRAGVRGGRGLGACGSLNSRHPSAVDLPRKGGGSARACDEKRSTPPASAEIPPASCRRRSARSAARSDRRGPLPAAPADARAATSRAPRTIAENGPAAARRPCRDPGNQAWRHSGRLSRSGRAGRDIKSTAVPTVFRFWWRPPPDPAPAHCPHCAPTDPRSCDSLRPAAAIARAHRAALCA